MNRPSLRRLGALLLSLSLLAVSLGGSPRAAAAASFSSSPGSIEANLALGSATTLPLQITNTSGVAQAPRIFEANAASIALAAAPAEARVGLPEQAERVDPAIAAEQAQKRETTFIAFLGDQADLAAAYRIGSWDERGRYVYETLTRHAERSQAGLRAMLDARGVEYQPFWIVNAIAVTGDAADLAAVSGRAEVAVISANSLATLGTPVDQPDLAAPTPAIPLAQSGCNPVADGSCWNIDRVGANRVWSDFGVRGEGIVVGTIDSGAVASHPALSASYRGGSGSGANHSYSWADFVGFPRSPTPADSGSHGTHVMGTLVGGGAGQPAVGVAPGADWVAARAFGATTGSLESIIAASQWMLAPTDLNGQNPRPDLRPHIINNSWSAQSTEATWYTDYVEAWRAAGQFPVFAAGKAASSSPAACGSAQAPGNFSNVVAVGNVTSADILDASSLIGPTRDGRVKPDISAPGRDIYSTLPGGGYGLKSGTSMASPHVAGAVALLWSANPELIGDYDRTYQILSSSALARTTAPAGGSYGSCAPTSVPNNLYGYGRLDIYTAVALASVDIPWLSVAPSQLGSLAPGASATVSVTLDARRVPGPGQYQARLLVHGADVSDEPLSVSVSLTVPSDPSHASLSGQVTSAAGGAALAATVSVAGGPEVRTDAAGNYALVLPPSATPYQVSASASGHIPRTQPASLGGGASLTLNFSLTPDAPELVLDAAPRSTTLALGESAEVAITLRNSGTRTLEYSLAVPAEQYGVWRSDEPDGPPAEWIAPSPSLAGLTIADNGFSTAVPLGFSFNYYGQIYSQVYIGANGLISFSPTSSALSYIGGCLPLVTQPGAAIVPLHAPLDPAAPGAKISAAQLPEGLLVSWENIGLDNDPGARLSFQALLRPDGRISLNYRDVAAITTADDAALGLQPPGGSAQGLGCEVQLGLADDLTIELRPTAAASAWASLSAPASGSLAPGASAIVSLWISWAPPGPWPASGALVVSSNDPRRPTARAPLRLTSTPAPEQFRAPAIFR